MFEAEKIYTAQEVADGLKISIQTVIRHLKHGDLTGFKVGNLWRIEGSEIIRHFGLTRNVKNNPED